jgi:YVTN family beta-propeller protein
MTITPIDLAAPRPEHRVTIGSLPSALTSTPGGRQILVTAQGDNTLVVLDTAGNDVAARVTTGLEPDAVAVTPDGKTAVVANFGDGTVTPVDLATMRALPAIAVGSQPDAVAVTPDGKTAVVANFGDGTVTPVDLATMRALPAIAVGPGPTAIAISSISPAGGAAAWVAVGASLVPVSLSALTRGTSVVVGHIAEAVAVTADGHTAWVAGEDGAITPVDLSTGRAETGTRVGGRPSAIAIAPPWT